MGCLGSSKLTSGVVNSTIGIFLSLGNHLISGANIVGSNGAASTVAGHELGMTTTVIDPDVSRLGHMGRNLAITLLLQGSFKTAHVDEVTP
jgi:hypothetical protein